MGVSDMGRLSGLDWAPNEWMEVKRQELVRY